MSEREQITTAVFQKNSRYGESFIITEAGRRQSEKPPFLLNDSTERLFFSEKPLIDWRNEAPARLFHPSVPPPFYMKHHTRSYLRALAALTLASPFVYTVNAAVETWVSGATSSFSLASNWTGTGLAPVSGDSWVLGATTGATTLTNDLTANINVAGITFNTGGSAYTIGGNAITLTGNISTAVATESLNFDIVTTAVRSVTTGFNNTLVLGGNISGTGGGLNKTGNSGITSILKLSGTNTYTGVTTVGSGMLQFAKEVSLYNNTTASWTATNLVVNSGATAAFNVGGTGEFTASDITTLAALGTAAGGFKTGAILGLDTTNAGGTFTYNTAIANSNAGANVLNLTKLGTGTLVLGGTNTYTGNTSVAAGTLTVTGTGSITSAGTLNLGLTSNSVFQYDSSATSTFGGLFAGSNNASDTINQTAGQINATGLSMNTGLGRSGTYNLSGGTLAVTGTAAVGQRNATSNFNLSGTGNLTVTGLLGVVSNTVLNGTSGATSGTVTQSGTSTATVGSLLLTNTNNTAQTYTNTATYNLNGGTLTTGSIGAVNIGTLGTGGANNSVFNFAGGTLKASASTTTFMEGLTTAKIKAGGATIDTNGFNVTIGQALLKNAGLTTETLTKLGTGTLTLSGTNTYLGATSVNAGTLATGATGTFGAGDVKVANGATLSLGNSSSIADTANVSFDTSASILLGTGINETVNSLSSISGTYISAGTYDATGLQTFFGSTGMFAGLGQLTVLSASAIPEPATYAALAGLGILGFAAYRRRRQAS